MLKLFKSHRRTKFVDHRQQTRFAIEVVLHALLFPIVFFLLTTLPPFCNWFFGDQANVLRQLYMENLYSMARAWPAVLVALVIVGFFSIVFSHRIFGPIRRFSNALISLNDKDSQPLRCVLRKTDYFVGFSKLLDKAVQDFEGRR